MPGKCHNFPTLLLGLLFLFWVKPSGASKIGCYEGIQQFMLSRFGERYEQDQNLVGAEIPGTRLFMITDKTPTINPPRYILLKTGKEFQMCLALTAPVANDIIFSKSRILNIPNKITTHSGGQGSDELTIRYTWNSKKEKYESEACVQGFGVKKKTISCKKILSTFD